LGSAACSAPYGPFGEHAACAARAKTPGSSARAPAPTTAVRIIVLRSTPISGSGSVGYGAAGADSQKDMPDDERDSDQPGVQFDDQLLPDEFPPDRPLGLGDQPGAYEDQEPEDFGDTLDDDGELEIETGVGPDGEDEELNVPVVEENDIGALDPDDEFTGDETTRDVATERVPPAAEDAAMHVEPEARQRDR
jgi:hypothetical protein